MGYAQCTVAPRLRLRASHLRFNSTQPAPLTPQPEQSQPGDQNLNEVLATRRKTLLRDLVRLSKLARPESKIIAAALLCLVTTSGVSMSLPLFIGKIIDTAKEPLQDGTVDITILGLPEYQFYSALLALFSVGAAANFGRMYLLRSAGERLAARLRSRVFSKILCQDSYFFDLGPSKSGMKTGDLISRISSDTQIIARTMSGNISDGARALISGVVGLSMMTYVLWQLSLCMSLIFPPLILMSTFYGRKIKTLSRQIQENLGGMTKVAEEKFNAVKTIQSFARQKLVVHEFNVEIKNIYNTSMREGLLSGIYYGGNGFLGNVTMVGLLVVGARLISSGDITIGDLSSFMMYALYTGLSVFGLGNFYTELMKGLGASERVFEIIDLNPTIAPSLGRKVKDLHGDIVFRDVQFRYPSRLDSPIFGNQPFNLTIKKGEHVCFVGPSGSGKSTISQLLLRFYDPIDGSVVINGHNIKELNLNTLRQQLGYVQQDPILFSGTIEENIRFGKPDCTPEEIEEALTTANAYDFVQAFPGKLDTVMGPSSSARLSGGQKQRLSIARTLIKRPDILVLDEATSALDSQLEEVVMRNLMTLAEERNFTMILIAHRLSTIRNSERVVVLSADGRIVEDGLFQHLYANPESELNKLLKIYRE